MLTETMQHNCVMEKQADRSTTPSTIPGCVPAIHPGTNVPQRLVGTQDVDICFPAEPLKVNQPVNELSLTFAVYFEKNFDLFASCNMV